MGLLKKVVGGVKKVFSGIKKAFKSITKSSLGKALLLAAAIYVGYFAYQGYMQAGTWEGALESVKVATGMGGMASSSLATDVAATEKAAEGVTAVAGTEAGAGASTANQAALDETLVSDAGRQASMNAATSSAQTNLASEAAKKAAAKPGWWAGQGDFTKYGLITAGAGAVQGAFSPNALDVAEREAELRREEEQRRYDLAQANLNVSGVSPGFTARPVIRDANGNPIQPQRYGLINQPPVRR